MNALVDLRSDTVTRPGDGMRRAMATADVGDDVFGEDPTVRALEERVATLFGRQAAMFTASGLMATQALLAATCPRGSEIICESNAHLAAYESGAVAILGNLQTRTVDGDRGRLDATAVSAAMRPPMFPATQLGVISVEETTNRGGGAIHGLARLREIREVADSRSVPLHVDGARIFNAIVATGVNPADYGAIASVFSFCLSKGLGAPVGSVAVGDADDIAEARRWRRRLGGDMRQAGVLAAAGMYALDHHVDRLVDDHVNARAIADRIASAVEGVVEPDSVETNMVYVSTGSRPAADVARQVGDQGVLIGAMDTHLLRLVTHLDVDAADCRRAADVVIKVLSTTS